MDRHLVLEKNPFDLLFTNYNDEINELFERLLEGLEKESTHSAVDKTKTQILKFSFAVLCKHTIEEAKGEYPFIDLKELIKEAHLDNHSQACWYLLGLEEIEWEDDYELNTSPFMGMMVKLIKKYIEYWGNYIRTNLSTDKRIEILEAFTGGISVPGSLMYMQAINFYISPL